MTFEQYAESRGLSLETRQSGQYLSSHTHEAHAAWLAVNGPDNVNDLISHDTLAELWEAYGMVDIDLMEPSDKTRVMREALPRWWNSDAMRDFMGDNLLAPLFWESARKGNAKVLESLFNAMQSDLQDCADNWELGRL